MLGRGSTKVCNFVHVDEIWKDHVNLELIAQRKWPEKWGFLSKTYQELEDGLLEIGEDKTADCKPKEKEKLKDKEDADITNVQRVKRPSVRFPETDSQLIGWRLKYKIPTSQNNLKHYGKKDIIKQLGWPPEGF